MFAMGTSSAPLFQSSTPAQVIGLVSDNRKRRVKTPRIAAFLPTPRMSAAVCLGAARSYDLY
jgi:hypothetical protein